jgi:pSer/pThr/pTyr-binding forkhead associated (FHA) protein
LRTRFSIRDLGSTNGTRVNGRPVEEQTLRSGDEVEIGMYRFLFLASYV